MVFGLNADRLSAPDLAVLAEGVEQSFAELQAAKKKPARKAKAAAHGAA